MHRTYNVGSTAQMPYIENFVGDNIESCLGFENCESYPIREHPTSVRWSIDNGAGHVKHVLPPDSRMVFNVIQQTGVSGQLYGECVRMKKKKKALLVGGKCH